MKKLLIMFLMMLISLFAVSSADVISEKLDLSDYPNFFVNNDRLDVSFVVGEFAKSEDVLSTVEIANSLQHNLQDIIDEQDSELFQIDVTDDPKEELTKLYMDVFNKKKKAAAQTILDTSLDRDNISDMNLIVVGGPCVNWVAAHFHGDPENCAEQYTPGRGYIELFRNGKGIVMVVAGYSAEDTHHAANILANYEDYSANFVGDKLKVFSAIIQETKIE
ncbi:hypothetical protein H6503_05970 [Candidatus Woesearchaeota archaeon]|nr:hypothetical protein [Candidatus Woesearchaeota archaeon]